MVEDAAAAPGSTTRGAWRSRTACSATTAPTRSRSGASRCPRRVALYRLNALDAAVKGAIEHGVGHDAPAPDGR